MTPEANFNTLKGAVDALCKLAADHEAEEAHEEGICIDERCFLVAFVMSQLNLGLVNLGEVAETFLDIQAGIAENLCMSVAEPEPEPADDILDAKEISE